MKIEEASIGDMNSVGKLFREYQEYLGVDLCFQNFEKELSTLPGSYGSPNGVIMIAVNDSQIVGCVGVRPRTKHEAELKRLYVQPNYRGLGIGKQLFEAAMSKAKLIGYTSIVLDTLSSLEAAKSLYTRYGFLEIQPYYHNPVGGVEYYKYEFS